MCVHSTETTSVTCEGGDGLQTEKTQLLTFSKKKQKTSAIWSKFQDLKLQKVLSTKIGNVLNE